MSFKRACVLYGVRNLIKSEMQVCVLILNMHVPLASIYTAMRTALKYARVCMYKKIVHMCVCIKDVRACVCIFFTYEKFDHKYILCAQRG